MCGNDLFLAADENSGRYSMAEVLNTLEDFIVSAIC
jgi:hypothetical protein